MKTLIDAPWSPDASETAQVLAALVASLTEESARDLHRLLALKLAVTPAGLARETRLGLLVELIDGTGEIPSAQAYDAARRARAESGEDWPDRTSLARAYGHWLAAIRAALRHWHLGTQGAVRSERAQPDRLIVTYTRSEVVAGLRACRRALGLSDTTGWPTQWEYATWRQLERRAARHRGLPPPRLPVVPIIRKLFGDYPRAVACAATEAADRSWRA